MILAQFDKILQNFTCFYGILGPFLCTKFPVKKIGCAKQLTLRKSVQRQCQKVQEERNGLKGGVNKNLLSLTIAVGRWKAKKEEKQREGDIKYGRRVNEKRQQRFGWSIR